MKHPDNLLLLKWADKSYTEEEYLNLVRDIAIMSHNDMVFVISKPIQDRLRLEVREELLVRSMIQSPNEKRLIQVALWLGLLSALVTILPFVAALLRCHKPSQ